jgi:hypothetical protein
MRVTSCEKTGFGHNVSHIIFTILRKTGVGFEAFSVFWHYFTPSQWPRAGDTKAKGEARPASNPAMVSLVSVIVSGHCLLRMDRGWDGRGVGTLTEQLVSVKSSCSAEFPKHGLGLALEFATFGCVP